MVNIIINECVTIHTHFRNNFDFLELFSLPLRLDCVNLNFVFN